MIKHLILLKIQKYDGCQGGLDSMVYQFLDQKTSDGTVKNENISNKALAEELHKPIIRNFNKKEDFGRKSSRYTIDK